MTLISRSWSCAMLYGLRRIRGGAGSPSGGAGIVIAGGRRSEGAAGGPRLGGRELGSAAFGARRTHGAADGDGRGALLTPCSGGQCTPRKQPKPVDWSSAEVTTTAARC